MYYSVTVHTRTTSFICQYIKSTQYSNIELCDTVIMRTKSFRGNFKRNYNISCNCYEERGWQDNHLRLDVSNRDGYQNQHSPLIVNEVMELLRSPVCHNALGVWGWATDRTPQYTIAIIQCVHHLRSLPTHGLPSHHKNDLSPSIWFVKLTPESINLIPGPISLDPIHSVTDSIDWFANIVINLINKILAPHFADRVSDHEFSMI